MFELDDVQAFVVDGLPLPVNCVVDPSHVVKAPVTVGGAVTVNVDVALQPALFT